MASSSFQKLENLTVVQLKNILRENDLEISGLKSDLIDRIIENNIRMPRGSLSKRKSRITADDLSGSQNEYPLIQKYSTKSPMKRAIGSTIKQEPRSKFIANNMMSKYSMLPKHSRIGAGCYLATAFACTVMQNIEEELGIEEELEKEPEKNLVKKYDGRDEELLDILVEELEDESEKESNNRSIEESLYERVLEIGRRLDVEPTYKVIYNEKKSFFTGIHTPWENDYIYGKINLNTLSSFTIAHELVHCKYNDSITGYISHVTSLLFAIFGVRKVNELFSKHKYFTRILTKNITVVIGSILSMAIGQFVSMHHERRADNIALKIADIEDLKNEIFVYEKLIENSKKEKEEILSEINREDFYQIDLNICHKINLLCANYLINEDGTSKWWFDPHYDHITRIKMIKNEIKNRLELEQQSSRSRIQE